MACDYDGTLAIRGHVDDRAVAALRRFRDSGRKLLLVTGRQIEDLLSVFPEIGLFDLVVAENGALLYRPGAGNLALMGEPPAETLVTALHTRGVTPLFIGHVVVSTLRPHQAAAEAAIRELGLDTRIILNKEDIMLLPPGIDKATGLAAALAELSIPAQHTAAIGDAENDHALLDYSGYPVAVANALPSVMQRACLVTESPASAGVVELVDRLLA